jgi:preprotein translocase SecE subunit
MAISIKSNSSSALDSVRSSETNPSTPKIQSASTEKVNFFKSTIQELSKAEWPTFKYILNWILVIIIFTTAVSVFLSFVDNTSKSGVNYVSCFSKKNTFASCNENLWNELTYNK